MATSNSPRQFYTRLSLTPTSLCGNVSMSLVLHIYMSSAFQWKMSEVVYVSAYFFSADRVTKLLINTTRFLQVFAATDKSLCLKKIIIVLLSTK